MALSRNTAQGLKMGIELSKEQNLVHVNTSINSKACMHIATDKC